MPYAGPLGLAILGGLEKSAPTLPSLVQPIQGWEGSWRGKDEYPLLSIIRFKRHFKETSGKFIFMPKYFLYIVVSVTLQKPFTKSGIDASASSPCCLWSWRVQSPARLASSEHDSLRSQGSAGRPLSETTRGLWTGLITKGL